MAAPMATRTAVNTALAEKMRPIAAYLIQNTSGMASYRDKRAGTPWVVLFQFVGGQKQATGLINDNGALFTRMRSALDYGMMVNATYVVLAEGAKMPEADPLIECMLYPFEEAAIAPIVAQMPRTEMAMPCIIPLCSAWIGRANPPILRSAIMRPPRTA